MNLLLVIAAAPLAASGYSSLSSFAGTARLRRQLGEVRTAPPSPSPSPSLPLPQFSSSQAFGRRCGQPQHLPRGAAAITMYESSHDPPSTPSFNAWSVLAKTERWISETLASTNDGMKKAQQQNQNQQRSGSGSGNPYTRKEVEYACENAQEAAMVTASVFRRLKEVREMGERHGKAQEEMRRAAGPSYEPRTFRKTQVVVIPGNAALMGNFTVFDRWMETINQARRNARDYVTDLALERLEDEDVDHDDDEDRWSVSVNCAHLHPKFGELTPRQQLDQMRQEDAAGEVDVNYQEYQERKMMARRSPYPTLVIEVRAVPPPDFGHSPPPSLLRQQQQSQPQRAVTSADIRRLEALFGKAPAFNHPAEDRTAKEQEEDFYNQIGRSIKEVSSVTPLRLAQEWLAHNDPDITGGAAFTESGTRHVDAAYEFVFTNLAMMKDAGTPRQYLVMPHFLSSSATSFEKARDEVAKLVAVLPDLAGKVKVHTYHPEHVNSARRSPVPVYVLEWRQGGFTN